MVRPYGGPVVLSVFLVSGDAAPLKFNVNESPRTEVRDISRLGNHGRLEVGKIEAIHENVVDAFQQDVLDCAVPKDLWYEIHNRGDDASVHRHFKHTNSTLNVEPITFCSCSLNEERSNRPREPNPG